MENQKLLRLTPQPFTSSRVLPNLYSLAYQSYRGMIISRRNQSIILHGQSETLVKKKCVKEIFKSYAYTNIIHQQQQKVMSSCSTLNTSNSTFTERLDALVNLYHFFCTSSCPFEKSTVLYNLEFDLGGRICGANAQVRKGVKCLISFLKFI